MSVSSESLRRNQRFVVEWSFPIMDESTVGSRVVRWEEPGFHEMTLTSEHPQNYYLRSGR